MSGVHRIDGQVEGTHDERPDASPANAGILYIETDTGLQYYSNGETWIPISDGAGPDTDSFVTLTDVDISGVADQQVLAYDQASGDIKPLPGVTGNGKSGVTTTGPVTINSTTADSDHEASKVNGSLEIDDAVGTAGNGGYVLSVYQIRPLTDDSRVSVATFARLAALNGHDMFKEIVNITDTTDATGHFLLTQVTDGENLANRHTLGKAGGIGLGGLPSPSDGGLATPSSISQGDGTAVATHSVKMGNGQTALPFSITDHADAPKASIAADGEIVTVDDVLAPFGTVKGAVLAFNPTVGTGAPSTGAHNAGEMVMDSTGAVFVCTADGTPGTWKQATLT